MYVNVTYVVCECGCCWHATDLCIACCGAQEEWHRLMKRVPAGYDPCTEAYVTKYFNRGDVQRALHANRTGLPYPYSPCRSALRSQSLSQRPF